MPEFLLFRKQISSPLFIEETINKNDVMVTGFDKIAVLFLTKVSSLVCEYG